MIIGVVFQIIAYVFQGYFSPNDWGRVFIQWICQLLNYAHLLVEYDVQNGTQWQAGSSIAI